MQSFHRVMWAIFKLRSPDEPTLGTRALYYRGLNNYQYHIGLYIGAILGSWRRKWKLLSYNRV